MSESKKAFEAWQASRQEGEPIGFLQSSGVSQLSGGHPAKLYPIGATPSPFESSTLVYTHPASRKVVEGEVAGLKAEIRTERDPSDEYDSFLVFVSRGKSEPYLFIPETLDDAILDEVVKRINTHPASAAPDEEYLRALQDAFDIIQADANTEENYGSLCRIGSVLGKLKDTPTNADVWIKCSERLPKESDGDCHGIVWVYNKGLSWVEISDLEDVKFISDYTHWMPTNLVRPEPPKQEEGQ